MNEIVQQIGQTGIIAIIVIDKAQDAIPLGEAFLDGGLFCVEVTFRTAAAAEAIHNLTTTYPEMLVGAGTILTIEQAAAAAAAGAKYMLSPGYDEAILDWCQARQILFIPGVMTPSEILRGYNKGVSLLKFFPAAAAGGPKAIQAIAGPLPEVKLLPTGGINTNNLADYLRLSLVHACGGSWLATRQQIAQQQFAQISQQAAEAVTIVQNSR